ncbi:Basal body-orientation factor 1 [Chlorella vulgaris]
MSAKQGAGSKGRGRPVRGAPPPPVEVKEPTEAEAEALLQQSRLQQAEAQLEASQAAYGKLCNDHQQLQEVRRHEEREGYELSELFRRQLLSKNEQLASMQAEVSAAVTRLQETEAAAAQREAQLKQDFEGERQQMGAAVAAVRAELAAVAQYRQGKQELEQELHRLRSDKVGIAEALGEKVRTLQRRLYELGFGADGLGEGSKAAASDDEEADDGLCLEADLHRLLAHSRKVEGEIRLYGQEAEELQREMKALDSERAALLRDVRLKEEMEALYAKRGTLQAREICAAHSKIGTLERGLAQMAADYELEKAELEQQLRAQLADAANEQDGLRRLLRLRTRELRHLRHLAQEVLLQRSDVEAFLVAGIQQVRGEIAAEAAAAAGAARRLGPNRQAMQPALAASHDGPKMLEEQGGSMASISLAPSRRGSVASRAVAPSAATSPTAASSADHAAAVAATVAGQLPGRIDVRELSWEDRERVLRLLFAKINKAAQQSAAPVQQPQPPSPVATAPPMQLRGLATEAGPASLA